MRQKFKFRKGYKAQLLYMLCIALICGACDKKKSESVPANSLVIENHTLISCPTAVTDSINNLKLSDDVTAIAPNAFKGNTSVLVVEGANVVTIGDGAFKDCPNLTTVRFSRVRSIGDEAFQNCSALKFFFSQVVPDIEWHTFQGCTRTPRYFVIPKSLYPDALNWEDAGFELMENSAKALVSPKYGNNEEEVEEFDV